MTIGGKAVVAGVAALLSIYWVHRAGQNRRLNRIVAAIEQLQVQAVLEPAVTAETAGIPGPPITLPAASCFQPLFGFEFGYLVERRADGDYLHHVIGRLSGGKAPELSEAMLAIMRRLVQQFSPAGLDYEVMLHVEVLPTGSQHIDFMMTAEQQAALLAVITPPSS